MTAPIRDLIARSSIGCGPPRLVSLVIAGPRDLVPTIDEVSDAVDRLLDEKNLIPSRVISGCARGVDTVAIEWARSVGLPVDPFPVKKAEWDRHGGAAGPMRNGRMANAGDALLVLRHRESDGTNDIIHKMRRLAKPFLVVEVRR